MPNKLNRSQKKRKANTAAEKQSSADAPSKLLIPNRPMLGREIMVNMPIEDSPQEEPILSNTKHVVIAPAEPKDTSDSEKVVDPPEQNTADEAPENTNNQSQATSGENSAPEEDATGPQTTPEHTPTEHKNDNFSSPKAVLADKAPAGPTTEAQKALQEIVEQDERQAQKDINSRQYFVPINAVAHKRSIKVSITLTLLVLLLGFALIDLMLDSGTILLLQKIPHTHFFMNTIYP